MRNRKQSFCEFGLSALRRRLGVFGQEVERVSAHWGVDEVHDVRVAARRLRAALSIFEECVGCQTAQRWRKRIGKTAKAMGTLRDTDVHLAFVRKSLAALGDRAAARAGVERLALRLSQERGRERIKAARAIEKLAQSGALRELRSDLAAASGRTKRGPKPTGQADLYARSAKILLTLLAELRSYEKYIGDESAHAELHETRIAAKHLRYAAEVLGPLYDGELKPLQDDLKRLQDLLGEFHDCIVWAEYLPEFVAQETQRTREYFGHAKPMAALRPGVAMLKADRQAEGRRLYRQVAEFWTDLDRRGVWTRLREQLKAATKAAGKS